MLVKEIEQRFQNQDEKLDMLLKNYDMILKNHNKKFEMLIAAIIPEKSKPKKIKSVTKSKKSK